MDKIQVLERVYREPKLIDFNDSTLIEIKTCIESLIEKYGNNAILNIEYDQIEYYREETDEEYETRLKQHKKNIEKQEKEKLKKEQKERELYETLKKKYESTGEN